MANMFLILPDYAAIPTAAHAKDTIAGYVRKLKIEGQGVHDHMLAFTLKANTLMFSIGRTSNIFVLAVSS